jgi:hypothetical protein
VAAADEAAVAVAAEVVVTAALTEIIIIIIKNQKKKKNLVKKQTNQNAYRFELLPCFRRYTSTGDITLKRNVRWQRTTSEF